MYVIIEMADVELLGVHVMESLPLAIERFEQSAAVNAAHEWPESELANEVQGTLRLAGDDMYSVHLLEVKVGEPGALPALDPDTEHLVEAWAAKRLEDFQAGTRNPEDARLRLPYMLPVIAEGTRRALARFEGT